VEKKQRDPANINGWLCGAVLALLVGFQYPFVALGQGPTGYLVLRLVVDAAMLVVLAVAGFNTTHRTGRITSGGYAGLLAGFLGGLIGGLIDSVVVSSWPALVSTTTLGVSAVPTTFGLEQTCGAIVLFTVGGGFMGVVGAVFGRLLYRKPKRASVIAST
jgi:hypothetical protein